MLGASACARNRELHKEQTGAAAAAVECRHATRDVWKSTCGELKTGNTMATQGVKDKQQQEHWDVAKAHNPRVTHEDGGAPPYP